MYLIFYTVGGNAATFDYYNDEGRYKFKNLLGIKCDRRPGARPWEEIRRLLRRGQRKLFPDANGRDVAGFSRKEAASDGGWATRILQVERDEMVGADTTGGGSTRGLHAWSPILFPTGLVTHEYLILGLYPSLSLISGIGHLIHLQVWAV